MSRRRFLLIFNVLAISLILVTGFVVYNNRQHIPWLKGLFGKAAVSQTYSVTESSPGNQYIIGVSITCSATSDVNASGFIVGWNVTISGSNTDVANISTGVKVHVPWNTALEGTNQVTGSQYYPGAQPPVVVASAETFAQPGYAGSLVQCNLNIQDNNPPPPPPVSDFGCEQITTDEIFNWFNGIGSPGSFDGPRGQSRISGGSNGLNYTLVRTLDKSTLTVTISNGTDKCFSGAVGVYKMYNGSLASQKYFSGKDSFNLGRGASASFSMPLPSCMAQIDIYGGIESAPRTLAEPGSQYPLLGWTYHLNESGSYTNPIGPVCNDVVDREPIGNFDAITCESITGWALDQDERSRSLDVHVYRDGQAGSGGIFLGSYPTNILRADVNQTYGATGNHGFAIPTPESLRDGQSHQVFIFVINPVSGKNNPLITGSPKTLTCPVPPVGACKLEINKTVDKATAEPGDELTYTLVLKNTGTAACGGATGVKVQDQYDTNIVFVRETHPSSVVRGYVGDGSPFHDLTNRMLTWNANLMQPGQSVSIQWVGQIKNLAACATATVVNIAKATADEYNHLQSFVTSAPVTTGVTASCPSPLVCAPATQQVTINKPATFSATGGSGTLTWQATGGTPSTGTGASFVTQYSQAGSKQVVVRAGSAQSTCAVIVVDDSTPPTPLVCSPATQSVTLNQQAIMVVSGATGTTTWSAPGATVTAGTGSTFSTAYSTNGTKLVTVTATNGSATCTVVVTGTPPAQTVDLAVQKSVAPSLIQVGQNAVFTISVTNNGPVDATNVALVDTLPAGVTIVNQVATQGNFNADTRVWTIGALAVSEVAELRITVSGDSVGSKLNTALLTASTPTDTNLSNNQAQATLTVVAGTVVPEVVCAPSFQSVRVNQQAILAAAGGTGSYNWTAPEATPNTGTGNFFSAYYTSVGSRTVTLTSGTKQTTCTVNVIPESVPTPQLDLAVTKQVAPALIRVGETSTFTIVVTNQSSVRGDAIQYKDTLPSGLTISSASASQGTFTGSTGVWDVGTLGANQSATLTISVVGPQVGTYINQVSLVTVSPQDTNSANNTASATLVVQSQPGGGNPSLVCASGVNTILVGQDVKFYANNASGLYSWSTPNGIPTVGTGSIFTTRFSQVGVQTATVTSGNQSAVCTVTVYAPTVLTSTDTTADLSLTKTVNPPHVLVGQETIFTITLHNAGPGSPDLVSVKDLLPQGLSVLRAVSSQGSYDPVSGVWAVGRMQVGQEVILLITARADKVGVLTNTSEVWTSALSDIDSTPGNSHESEDDQASATVTVEGILPKSGSPTLPIIFFALLCMVAAASAVQIRTVRIARLQTPLGEVEVPLDSL